MMYTLIPNETYPNKFFTIRRDDGKVAVVTYNLLMDGNSQMMARQLIGHRRDDSPIYSWPCVGRLTGIPLAKTIPDAFNSGAIVLGPEFWT